LWYAGIGGNIPVWFWFSQTHYAITGLGTATPFSTAIGTISEQFIETVNVSSKVEEDWRRFVYEQKETDLAAIICEEKLKQEETRKFIDNSLRDYR